MSTTKPLVDPRELEKFNKLAQDWWDPTGPFKPLHIMNPVRLNYINDWIDLTGKRVLDVGCGGGILTESMARRGAQVTGIDLAEKPLLIARDHAKEQGLDIEYIDCAANDMANDRPESYDIVTCLEMLEHVPQPDAIVATCTELVRPGGTVVFSTINRTAKAFALAIVGAEYILHLLPRGTHEFKAFIRPSELVQWAGKSGLTVQDTTGLIYNPFIETFRLSQNVSVNYMIMTTKTG